MIIGRDFITEHKISTITINPAKDGSKIRVDLFSEIASADILDRLKILILYCPKSRQILILLANNN